MSGGGWIANPLEFAWVAGGVLSLALLAAARWPAAIAASPRAVLIALAAVSGLAASALFSLDPLGVRLTLDPSTEPLLPRNDPGQALYRKATLDFGDDEVYVVVLDCDEVFSVACLRTLESVGDRVARLPGVSSVSSLLDVTSFRWVAAEQWIEVRPFIEDVPEDPAVLAELRARALADPVYRRNLVSEDARSAAINVRFHEMTDAELIASDLDGAIEAIVREHTGAGRRFFVSGRPHFKTRIYHGMIRDLRVLIPLSVLVIGAVLGLFYGSLRAVLLPLSTGLCGVLWTFGAMAVLERPLSLLTVLVGPTLLAVGSVYGLHVFARYEEEAQAAADARQAVARCLDHIVAPVAIAGLTTVIGFGALMLSDVPAVFELGAFSVLGVASITLLALAGVPAALALLPLRAGRSEERPLGAALVRSLEASVRGVRAAPTALLVGFAVLVVAAAAAIPHIVVDTDYLSYFPPDDPVRRDFEAVNERLSGAVPFYVVIDGREPGALREPELLRGLETLQQRIEALAGVGRALSFLDSLRPLNRAFNADDPAEERIPDTRKGVTELLFMIPKADISRHVTVNHLRANLIARTGEVGSAAVRRLTEEIEAVIAATPLPGGARAEVTGNAILLARSADGIARAQPLTVGVAALAIFALISIGLRSPRLGAVAMVPNLVPVLLFFGLLGTGVAPLSLPTSLIGCIALGLAIDDTVHYLVRYGRERGDGVSPDEAIARATRRVGHPIAVTSVMLAAGFAVIALSDFATLQEFGWLTAATMGLCLVTDLLLLPALLLRLRI